MAEARILQIVRSCKECPRRRYYSGGRHECTEVGTTLELGKELEIPDWCPLARYPTLRASS